MKEETGPKLMSTEEAIAYLIQELMHPRDVKMNTDLDDEEVAVMSIINTIAERLKMKSLKIFVENFAKFRISRYRLGRREAVEIAIGAQTPFGSKPRSIKDLFVGMR